jgi:hypothetical protein
MSFTCSDLPVFGVGLECPRDIEDKDGTDQVINELDILQLIPENFFFGKRPEFLKAVGSAGIPVILHSIDMSLGTDEGFRQAHFDRIKTVMDSVNCVAFSDHLCMIRADGVEIGQLTTLPFTKEACDVACRNIETLKHQLRMPFMIENITNRFIVPDNELSETEFLNLVTRRTGSGLLLDITNTYTNSVNFRFDPYEWLDQLDLASIAGIHLAGGVTENGVLYDTHSRPVPPPVLTLSQYVARLVTPRLVIVEWDQDTPTVPELIAEAMQARSIFYGGCNTRTAVPTTVEAVL